MSEKQLTVMGPGGIDGPTSALMPPRFNDESDKLAWREAVIDWSENVLACAAGGDNKAKGMAACLGLTLYRSLPLGTKEQIKQSVRSGEITLTPNGDTGPKQQIELVRKIMDIVAKDTAIDRISRMVRLNTHVHKCVRRSNESIKEFVARFKIPSFAYLNIVRADYHSPESQIFAMTLIINAKLGEQLFANTISTLISGTKCMTEGREVHIAVRKARLERLVQASKARGEEDENIFMECIKVIESAINAHDNQANKQEDAQKFISLANALETLESISLEQKSLGDIGSKTANEPTLTTGLMGSDQTRDGDRYGGNRSYGNWNNRPRPGYGQGLNKGRYQGQRPWRGREDWGGDRTDLRKEIEKKRTDRIAIPESKNEERFKKRAKFGDERSTEQGQNFR